MYRKETRSYALPVTSSDSCCLEKSLNKLEIGMFVKSIFISFSNGMGMIRIRSCFIAGA